MRKGDIVGAVEPEVHQERIHPRSDPAIIHPRGQWCLPGAGSTRAVLRPSNAAGGRGSL